MTKHKLSASAISTFLKSPRSYYWRYLAKLEPCQQTTNTYDEAKLAGVIWAQAVDRFYKQVAEGVNRDTTLKDWLDKTEGWVPDTKRDKLTKALEAWVSQYYQQFSPDDGVRTSESSELWVENDRFCGILDGISKEDIIHEVKSTSRAPQLSEQVWKVSNSIQIRLYSVITGAKGYQLEFAFKDPPYALFRCPIVEVTERQRVVWELELNALANSIYALGNNIHHFPCHTDGCCMVSKNMVSMCPYQLLCAEGLTEDNKVFYKAKEHR